MIYTEFDSTNRTKEDLLFSYCLGLFSVVVLLLTGILIGRLW